MVNSSTIEDRATGKTALLEQMTRIAAAYMTNSRVPASDIAGLLHAVHSALVTLGQPTDAEAPAMLTPAVPIRKSVTPAYIVCLEDGRRLKMLKRHLRSTYGMTPDDYRTRWGLPHDYPMVAPAYAERRSQLAKDIGLGRRPAPEPAPTKRVRRKGANSRAA